jgi:hypothetical protein
VTTRGSRRCDGLAATRRPGVHDHLVGPVDSRRSRGRSVFVDPALRQVQLAMLGSVSDPIARRTPRVPDPGSPVAGPAWARELTTRHCLVLGGGQVC